MSFGAIVAVKAEGSIFERIPVELESALTEIRVEQALDERTSFALRFQEDYENDEASVTKHDIFKDATELAILVPNGPDSKELICLVRGQIEQLSFDVAVGGPGSSFEARGQDVRTVLDRVCVPENHDADPESPESPPVLSHVLIPMIIKETDGIDDIVPSVEDGTINYDGKASNPSLNHIGTKLELIEFLAEQENKCVWLSYQAKAVERGILITTTFNVKASPPRSDVPPPPSVPALDKRPLRLIADSKECPNVSSFKVSSDNERAKVVTTSSIDDANGGTSNYEGKSADDNINDGQGVDETGGDTERSWFIPGPGGHTERAALVEKAATDESWFITAEAMTSASMYGAVLQPHEQVKVVGVGCEWGGYYQIEEVTHVINAAEHWMSLTLRSNSRGEKKL